MLEHVHLLFHAPPNLLVSALVREVKGASSRWMSLQMGGAPFAWQRGYGVFSVSASQVPRVVRYIANQERHHQTMTFEKEREALEKSHGRES